MRDGAAAAYLSLGVVEHDVAGPERLLAEARRVLAPRGRLVLSVPYLNGVRRLFRAALLRRQRAVRAAGGEFYQYAFTRPEVRRFLDRAGFDVLSLSPSSGVERSLCTRWMFRASCSLWLKPEGYSPGWHESTSQIAASVRKRIARALPVLRIERLARVMPIRSAGIGQR